MPCLVEPEPALELLNCPCNFDVGFWTNQAQILQTENATACDPGTMDPPAGSPTDACFTCDIAMWSFNSTTFLNVVVDLWVDGKVSREVSTEDALFFTATDSSEVEACFAEGSVDFKSIYTTIDPLTQEAGELLVTSEEVSVCLLDMTEVQNEFLSLCQQ
jgi:hypothetical protein